MDLPQMKQRIASWTPKQQIIAVSIAGGVLLVSGICLWSVAWYIISGIAEKRQREAFALAAKRAQLQLLVDQAARKESRVLAGAMEVMGRP